MELFFFSFFLKRSLTYPNSGIQNLTHMYVKKNSLYYYFSPNQWSWHRGLGSLLPREQQHTSCLQTPASRPPSPSDHRSKHFHPNASSFMFPRYSTHTFTFLFRFSLVSVNKTSFHERSRAFTSFHETLVQMCRLSSPAFRPFTSFAVFESYFQEVTLKLNRNSSSLLVV